MSQVEDGRAAIRVAMEVAQMIVSVRIEEDCRIDLAGCTGELLLLAKECVNALRERLGREGGVLTGSQPVAGQPGTYEWADQNWRIIYTTRTERHRIFWKRVIVSIKAIELA